MSANSASVSVACMQRLGWGRWSGGSIDRSLISADAELCLDSGVATACSNLHVADFPRNQSSLVIRDRNLLPHQLLDDRQEVGTDGIRMTNDRSTELKDGFF